MTAVLEHEDEVEGYAGGVIEIPAPLEHQLEAARSIKRYKIIPAGRRYGKSILALNGATMGHGPITYDARGVAHHLFRGISEGAKVAWVGPDAPQTRAIWDEELLPRFAGKNGVRVSLSDRIIRVNGGGKLEIRSAEAIDGLRGRYWDGVVLEEAAHWDLEYGWRRVIRPSLADTGGWAFIISSPDIGSYFNKQAQAVVDALERQARGLPRLRGSPNPRLWGVWTGRTRDNPALAQDEIEELYDEYPPGSTDAAQELDAELLEAHGDLFKIEYFQNYIEADSEGMTLPDGTRVRFVEVCLFVDLASSMKEKADYFACMVVGFGPRGPSGRRRAGVLHVHNAHEEGPDQIGRMSELIDEHGVTDAYIESVQYQLTAVQHLRRMRPDQAKRIHEVPVDRDKRSRAVPWAAAMARGDVWWPLGASWYDLAVKQHLKFPNGQEDSPHAEDHDDIVDTGSMAATKLVVKPKKILTAGTGTVRAGR